MATKQEKLNPQPRLSVVGVKKELSVSVTPCCFNLAEAGEKESTFEISNKNFFPLYFRILTTNSHAMSFEPRSGRLDPLSKVVVTGYHVQSARPIGYQQKLAIMTSRLPLEEWPDQEHYLPALKESDDHHHNHRGETHHKKSSSESDRSPDSDRVPSAHFERYQHPITDKTRRNRLDSTARRNTAAPFVGQEDIADAQRGGVDGPHSKYNKSLAEEAFKKQFPKSRKIEIFCHCGRCRGFDQPGKHLRRLKEQHKQLPKVHRNKGRCEGLSTDSEVFYDPVVTPQIKEFYLSSSGSSSGSGHSNRSSRVLSKCNHMLNECNRILNLTKVNFVLILMLFLMCLACLVYMGIKSYRLSPHCFEHPWLLYNFCSK